MQSLYQEVQGHIFAKYFYNEGREGKGESHMSLPQFLNY